MSRCIRCKKGNDFMLYYNVVYMIHISTENNVWEIVSIRFN